MADEEDLRNEPSDDDDDDEQPSQQKTVEPEEDRNEELRGNSEIRKACEEVFKDVDKGFADQWERANATMDYWDIYNCNLGAKQFYNGNSKIFIPIVHDAVEARKTRFTNQVFPVSGKHVEVTASEDKPTALMSLLEHYIRKTKMRTKIMPALCKNGDTEGQYTICVGWTKNERHVAMRVKRKPTVDAGGAQVSVDGDEEFDDIQTETITHEYPHVEVIADSDILILPQTADSVEDAIDDGGSATIVRRWSKAKIRQLIRDKEIDKTEGQKLLAEMVKAEKSTQTPDKKKHMLTAAGIQGDGGVKRAQVFETWTKIKVEGERRICRIYFGGEKQVLSAKRNPYWCDKVPILSAPVDKVEGAFKGQSKLKFVETLQYAANDAVNEGMDSAAYALLPIIMTDPEKNPRTGSMILNVAAIWETNPQSTQFAQFPQLWKEALQIVGSLKDQTFQTLGVNPAMMPQQVTAPGKKPNQAQIANEQMVDILTTADAVTTIENEILSPMLQWWIYLDHQYREDDVTIPQFGEMGVHAAMERIEPIQMDRRFEFRWFGVEAARNAQQIQMQMAGMNVIRNIPPDTYKGYRINMAPLITHWIENAFGPRLAAQVFIDERKELTLDPHFENSLLEAGHDMPTHTMDDDQAHLKVHGEAFQASGDMHGSLRKHMMQHTIQMQLKQQAKMLQQKQQLVQSAAPGGGQPPRQGAKPGGPRPNGQGPAGQIPRDRLQNAAPRPRGGM
jgi:hypothetical protein